MITPARLVTAAALAAILLAAGCGGGGDGDSGGGNGSAGAENERLTDEQWQEYTAGAATYDATLEESSVVFVACQEALSSAQDLSECIGGEIDPAVGATLDFSETLASFDGTVAGACSDALTQYTGAVKIHASTLNALVTLLEGDSAPGLSTAVDDVVLGREQVTAAAESFVAVCQPA